MGLSVYENQDGLFRTFVLPAVRWLPAEAGNNLALMACKYRLYPVSGYRDNINLKTSFFGRPISNPIGIAAGFDKNGEAVRGLKDLGFGFIEIGSVTPQAQKGNPKPRIFRLHNDRAIINRKGVDSDGHEAVVRRLRQLRATKDFDAVVGVNLERNRTSKTPVTDYMTGVKTFAPWADYLVVNYDHLKGMRSVNNKTKLIELLAGVNKARSQLGGKLNVPILLKLSPDLTLDEMRDVADVIEMCACKVDGLIVSNATMYRDNLRNSRLAKENGVISGEPLRDRSTRLIAQMYELTKGCVPIIGVGGVSSGRDAYEKIAAGASYVQIYTAFVYEGPELVDRVKGELSAWLTKLGYANINKAVGSNYQRYLPCTD
ncbi:dihydroorotate dehydrogenase (quinone), mitochondrial-like isoform X2 [Drosophila montana]